MLPPPPPPPQRKWHTSGKGRPPPPGTAIRVSNGGWGQNNPHVLLGYCVPPTLKCLSQPRGCVTKRAALTPPVTRCPCLRHRGKKPRNRPRRRWKKRAGAQRLCDCCFASCLRPAARSTVQWVPCLDEGAWAVLGPGGIRHRVGIGGVGCPRDPVHRCSFSPVSVPCPGGGGGGIWNGRIWHNKSGPHDAKWHSQVRRHVCRCPSSPLACTSPLCPRTLLYGTLWQVVWGRCGMSVRASGAGYVASRGCEAVNSSHPGPPRHNSNQPNVNRK